MMRLLSWVLQLPHLPAPTTFADGQKALYGWLVAGAGMAAGAAALAVLAVLVWGGWPDTLYHLIVTILGLALGGYIVVQLVVTLVLAIGGPVSKISVDLDERHVSINTEGDTE